MILWRLPFEVACSLELPNFTRFLAIIMHTSSPAPRRRIVPWMHAPKRLERDAEPSSGAARVTPSAATPRRFAWLIAALVCSSPLAAHAQSAAIDITRFHPAPGSGRIMATELAEVGPDLQIVPQLFFHYAKDPMLFTQGGEPVATSVRNRFTGELSLALALAERYQVGLALPVTVFQSGDELDIMPGFEDVSPPSELTPSGIEDVRLSAKGLLWEDRDQGYALGASGHLTFQTGDDQGFMSSGGPTFDLRLLGSMRRDRLAVGVNLGWLFAGEEQVFATQTGMGVSFGVGAQYDVLDYDSGTLAVGAELYGLAHNFFDDSREIPIELLVSGKASVHTWTFFLGAGPGLTRGYGEPDVRVLAGVSFAWDPTMLPPPPPPPPPAPPEPEPEPQPEPPPPPPEPEGQQWVDNTLVLLSNVLFGYDKCALSEQSHDSLREVAMTLQQHPEWGQIRIEGHASQEGKPEYNLRLSSCRAMAVRKFLIANGVAAERLQSLGFGDTCPKFATGTPEEMQQNRRVEFIRDPANNPPRCEVPAQLQPLFKHRQEIGEN